MAKSKPPTQASQEREQERRQRDELFGGAGEGAAAPASSAEPQQTYDGPPEQTVQQLVNEAVNTHKETTQTANRALRILEETKQLQGETLAALEKQGKQLDNVERNMTLINVELSYSEKLLIYMRRCCCWSLCDCCTGADPETKLKNQWRRRAEENRTGVTDYVDPYTALAHAAHGKPATPATPAANKGADAEASTSQPRHRDPDIRLMEGMESTEMKLHEETRKQNQALDQITQGLDDIMRGAEAMKGELTRHNEHLDKLDTHTENTAGRIVEVNNKSQLSEFRTKNNNENKDNNSMSLKKSILKYALT